jgi:hypothetical protein
MRKLAGKRLILILAITTAARRLERQEHAGAGIGASNVSPQVARSLVCVPAVPGERKNAACAARPERSNSVFLREQEFLQTQEKRNR